MKVITGGQTGCDQASLRAARACGIETGGFAARGWLTEDGPAEWLRDYGLEECPEPGYPARTSWNVNHADAVLLVGDPHTPGSTRTLREAMRYEGKPVLICSRVHEGGSVRLGNETWPVYRADEHFVRLWLLTNGVGTLLVAGSRESRHPGIGRAVETWLKRVFGLWVGDQHTRERP